MTASAGGLAMRAASTDITPVSPSALFGRIGRTGDFTHVASRLEANCLLIENGKGSPAATIAIDSLYPSQSLIDAVRNLCAVGGLNFATDALMFVASHTHNAPALDDTKPKLGQFDPAYLEHTAQQIADCLLGLNGSNANVTNMAIASSNCGASIFRRRKAFGLNLSTLRPETRMMMAPNPHVGIDHQLKLLVLSDNDGTARCVIWSWACHAVSEPEEMSVSADFPGVLRTHIRAVLDNESLPVLYFPGFSGDIRPASASLIPLHKSGKWVGAGRRFGKASAAYAERLHGALKHSINAAFSGLSLCGAASEMDFSRTNRHLPLSDIRSEAASLAPLTCQDWSIGPARIKAVSSEIASPYSSAAGGGDALAFVTGCAGQVFGYLPTDSQIPEGGYEVSGFAPMFSIPGDFNTAIEAQIAELIGP
ncbi:MAG: hypothetical protein ABJP34_02885 [Erythrobacter sp.]